MGEIELGPDAYVFSDRIEGSSPVRPDAVTGFFRRVSNDLSLPEVHLHSLRHFMATQLASRGDVSARTLAGRLGHADASVSLKVYSAFFPPADAEAAEHVGRLLNPS
jgi:integrase